MGVSYIMCVERALVGIRLRLPPRTPGTLHTVIKSALRAIVILRTDLTDLLDCPSAHPVNRREELIPDHWQHCWA